MLCKEGPLRRKILEQKCEYRYIRFLMQLKYLKRARSDNELNLKTCFMELCVASTVVHFLA